MAQHVMLFNALSPSDQQGWDTMDAELSCEHARDVDAINLLISRSQAERAESGLMQGVSMVRFEYNDWAELFRLWQTAAFSRPSVESLRRKFFVSPRPPPKEVQDALSEVLCFADLEASTRKGPWLRNRDAFRDAAFLVSGEEGAQAFFSLFVYETNQTALFLPLRRFQLAPPALTRVSRKEALNPCENHHEFMFEYDQGTCLQTSLFCAMGSWQLTNSRWLCRSFWRHADHARRAPTA